LASFIKQFLGIALIGFRKFSHFMTCSTKTKNNRVGALFLAILILLFNAPSARAQQALFTTVTAPEGSSWGQTIASITQDHQGYIWLATSVGIHRYDGYHLISFRHDPSNTNSLATNRTRTLFTDRKGFIWIGTDGEGVDKLDPASGTFTHYKGDSANKTTLENNNILSIVEDRDGAIWIGTEKGLNKLDPKTGKVTRFQHNAADASSISNGFVTTIYEDKQGTLWVGTAKGLATDETSYGGLNRMDKKKGNFTRYQHQPTDPHSLIDDRISAIFEDSYGTFWVGTSGHGLHKMDRAKGTFERIPNAKFSVDKLGLPAPENKNSIYEYVTFITEDAAGTLWMGTWQKGLYRYNPRTKKTMHYEADTVSGFVDKSAWRVYASREGVVWISTIPGSLYKIDPLRTVIPFYPTNFPVAALYKDASGLLWMGSEKGGGLIQVDRTKKSIKSFVYDSLNPKSISNSLVERIYKDRKGTLWVGTQDGLNRFHLKEGTFTQYKHDPKNSKSITKGHTHALYEDGKGNLWVGTQEGLNLMDRKDGTFRRYLNNPSDTNSLSNNSITSIASDRNGDLWVGTQKGGLNKLNKRTGICKRYLRGGVSITNIMEDASGVLWVSASGGLYRYDRVMDNFILFTDPSAGITTTTSISRIFEDNEQNLWGSMSKYIFRINKGRTEVSVYGKNNGVKVRTASGTEYQGEDGELFFAYETGYHAFYPDEITQSSKPPQVVIADFRISDKEVIPGTRSPLTEPLAYAKEINLKYFQNDFSFDFVGIHYSSPDDNRHFYMLENLDNTWRKAGSDKVAYYYNVPPGKYVFRVKSASSDGIWSEKSITVNIGDRWWLSWWAYTIYAVLVALVIWGIAGYRSRSLRHKNKYLEEKVAQRTNELNHQKEELQTTLEDLKATQAQLIQKEKMASLGELTAGIAHEIQNPLNFINNFSDLNTEIIEEIKTELAAGNTEEVLALSENVKQNNEKITYHGKRADAIVKGMLQHSRKNAGIKEPTDINALADEYLRLSYHGLRASDKNFNSELHTNFDATIEKLNVIPQDIGRVLLNLFNNAFYAVNEKKKQLNGTFEPSVSVTTKRLKNKVEIYISDNGIGISKKALNKIFQPFYTTKPSGQGTGLGLSLSYDIIKAHGGELRVETKEGEFAEFHIELPLT
jgi:ligand-binding sensor domain-containing protein/signal transduction histidine kinase